MINPDSNLNLVDPLANCQKSTGIIGWLKNFFGWTIRVVDGNNVLYFDKSDLLAKLCLNLPTAPAAQKQLSELMVEVLNPVQGLPITIDKVRTVFQEIRTSFLDNPFDDLKTRFEELKTRRFKVLTYDAKELEKNLKPGDIFFYKNPEDTIARVQNVFSHFCRATSHFDREGYKYTHAAIYVGNGEVAEAVMGMDNGVQLRLIKLDDPRFDLNKHPNNNYLITRPADEKMAFRASEIARTVVTEAVPVGAPQSNNGKHKYAFLKAARSLYHRADFGFFAKARYIKQYLDRKQGSAPLDFMSPNDFYCSNFVGYCLQTAESEGVLPRMIGNSEPPKVPVFLPFTKAVVRDLWARVERWKNLFSLDEKVKMKFDAKWFTPQDFRHFVVSHEELFKDMLFLKPAQAAV